MKNLNTYKIERTFVNGFMKGLTETYEMACSKAPFHVGQRVKGLGSADYVINRIESV